MTTEDIKVLADSEMETGRSLAIGLGIVSAASLVIIGLFTAVTAANLLAWAFFGIVAFGAAGATGALFWAYRRRNELLEAFKKNYLPAPKSTPSTLPAETTKDETQEPGRGGYAERKLHGIPALTWEWMCNYIVKNSWAEEKLEGVQVPYMPLTYFGKAQGNTIYNQMFHSERGVFIRAGIVGGRVPKQKGNLLIDNPVEMMALIKALSEE